MSDWFNVLKMPANIDLQATRDSDYTQVIVQYEKDHIAPYFDDYLRQGDALSREELVIAFDNKSTDDSQDGSIWYIGTRNLGLMGNNTRFIIDEIDRQYQSAGWQTENLGDQLIIDTPAGK
tara:strand:+ start:306 stop:668 length:363 start_codon:yes stop_codon:yes gene_type:complete